MPKLNTKFDPKQIFVKLTQNLSWVFFATFLILLVFEGLELKKSADIIFKANEENQEIVKVSGVRINFDNYNQVVKRIDEAGSFNPTGGITKNPFNPGAALDSSSPQPAPQSSGSGAGDDSSGTLQLPE